MVSATAGAAGAMLRRQFTLGRMMVETLYLGLLLAPIGCAARTPPGASDGVLGMRLLLASGWVALLLLTRFVYRSLPNPFG